MSAANFVNPAGLLDPPGPYSQVVHVGELAFVSGQVGADASGVIVGDDVVGQAEQALRNIGIALESIGLGLGNVVKVTIFVAYAEDLDALVPAMDRFFPDYFPDGFPASSLVIVQRLFAPALRIEIEAIAHR